MLVWKDCTFTTLDQKVNIILKDLQIEKQSFTTLMGANGSGKSLFARALNGELTLKNGTAPTNIKSALISFEKQQELIEADFERRNSDDEGDLTGFTPREMFNKASDSISEILRLCQVFNFTYALDRSYYLLSSGEGRKALLIEAMLKSPDLLILDAPFDGLDVKTRDDLINFLQQINKQGVGIILIINRFAEIPDFTNKLGIIMSKELVKFGDKDDVLNDDVVKQLNHYEHLPKIYTLPKVPSDCIDPLDRSISMVKMNDVTVKYGDHIVINKLNWEVKPYEHWQITGPNGCGKSTLLSLITGDNPQCYCNDMSVFGIKRGSGETIWDIKKHIGYVSPSFHLDYRISSPIVNVILSGYFDSIGLYEQPGDDKINLALKWLDIIGLKDQAKTSFKSLSFGQQRLLLIIRALVKQPPLLILDEPLQGLDGLSRELVKKFIEFMMNNGETQILFVSHHAEDIPNGITHKLEFTEEENSAPDSRKFVINQYHISK